MSKFPLRAVPIAAGCRETLKEPTDRHRAKYGRKAMRIHATTGTAADRPERSGQYNLGTAQDRQQRATGSSGRRDTQRHAAGGAIWIVSIQRPSLSARSTCTAIPSVQPWVTRYAHRPACQRRRAAALLSSRTCKAVSQGSGSSWSRCSAVWMALRVTFRLTIQNGGQCVRCQWNTRSTARPNANLNHRA